MDTNGFDYIQELLSNLYSNNGKKCEGQIDYSAGASGNKCRDCNLDMENGFQDVNPMLFNLIGEVVSNILSGNMPSSIANSFGNWLQLIAQVMLTYNSQQAYFQSGPGRCYDPKYRNVSNPFCKGASYSGSNGKDAPANDEENKPQRKEKKHRSKKNRDDKIEKLEEEVELLMREVRRLKEQR